jgi:hypothetical protein
MTASKRVLVVYFSQTMQLRNIVESVCQPLFNANGIEVVIEQLSPLRPYPFPWPFLQFFDTFPETVYDDPEPIQALQVSAKDNFDLIILAYQVWFLSPSQPVTAFLASDAARSLCQGTPVVTLIGCRNMWLMAQEKVKARLVQLGAHLIDNIALTDSAHSALTFISTPLWLLTNKQGPFFGGLIPKAGVSEHDIRAAKRFGEAIAAALPKRRREDTVAMLRGLGAVKINVNLITAEKVGLRSFRIWGSLLRLIGRRSATLRRVVLIFYIVFLIFLILTIVPITAIIKRLLAPLMHRRLQKQRAYFAAPSGEVFDKEGDGKTSVK